VFGSITARPIYFGTAMGGVTSIKVDEPVVVAHTWPLRRPTMRTLSFCGETPIALIGVEAVMGAWLSTVFVAPSSVDRYNLSEPK
jgi:hypothetical protein